MGFKYWYEGFVFILTFFIIVGAPCFFTAWMGSKLINDLGNAPTQAARIQLEISGWMLAVYIPAFACMVGFFRFFS